MYLTVRGLVLRVTNYNDHDGLLTVLTGDYGKLTVKARGLRRKNSPLAASCQLLSYSEFTLFESRGMYTVNESHPIDFFHALRSDLGKLALGTYFAQAAEVLSQEDMPNPELLSLTLNCLYALSNDLASENMAKAVFELRSACMAGYMPDLSGCCRCSNQFPDLLDISEGRLECCGCRTGSEGIRMPISSGVLDAMRYICYCEPKKVFSFHTSQQTLEALAQVSESYLTTQLERGFSTLDFYKSLQAPYCT